MANTLPENPNLDHLRKQAKDLRTDRANLPLHEAQHLIAQQYGFESWPKLVRHVESIHLSRATRAELVERFKQSRFHARPFFEAERVLAADPSIANVDLMTACVACNPEVVRSKLAKEQATDTHLVELFFSPFAKRKMAEVIACAELLIDAGANPSAATPDRDPLSVLYAAVSLPSLDAVKMLLERGANPNDNESLYHSSENDGVEFTKLLLEYGAKVEGTNALNRTADFEKPDLIRLLLETGYDPNRDGTLLHAINRGRSVEFIKVLLEFGADPSKTNFIGLSARAMAYQRGYPLDLFGEPYQPTTLDQVIRASYLGEPAPAATFDPAEFHRGVALAFDEAASNGKVNVVRRLIQSGLMPACPPKALHNAAWGGYSDVIRVLVEAGADLSVRDSSYDAIPLQWAMFSSNTADHDRHPEAARTMIELGSPPPVRLFGSDRVIEVVSAAFPEVD